MQTSDGMNYAPKGKAAPVDPAGWLVPMPYIRNRAHVRLIVPSKMGHQAAMQNVYPFYYDIKKYQFWR